VLDVVRGLGAIHALDAIRVLSVEGELPARRFWRPPQQHREAAW
jgi:hypothetical protein